MINNMRDERVEVNGRYFLSGPLTNCLDMLTTIRVFWSP
mgnify:CR=1 FL=1